MAKITTERAKAKVLDASLREMFRTLEAQPLPPAVSSIVEQLQAQDQAPLRKAS